MKAIKQGVVPEGRMSRIGKCLVLGSNAVDEDGQNTPPGVQIVRGNTAATQALKKKAAEVLNWNITELISNKI